MNINIITIVKKFYKKNGLIFSYFNIRVNCTFTQSCLCMKPKGNSVKTSVSVAPLLFADQQFKKAAAGLLPKV